MASHKLTSLRNLFKSSRVLEATGGRALQAYCLPGTDAHNSEYIADADFRVKFLSNFSGSNSYVVVTNQDALLWTDGRYFVQAEKQLGEGWTLQKQGQLESVTPTEWLCSNLAEGDVVGFDPELMPYDTGIEMRRKLTKLGITAVAITGNLVDEFWTERPKPTVKKLITLSDSEAGESIASKTERIRAELTKKKCAGGVFAALDDIMWFLNVRGSDISHNPLAFSYLFIENNSIHFFICEEKLDDEIKKHLLGITFHKYEEFLPWLTDFRKKNASQKIFVPSETNFAIGSILADPSESGTSPIQSMKAVKNATEMQNMRESNIRDSAALVEFLYWAEQELMVGKSYTELEMAKKVDGLRAGYPKFVDLSFGTISAGGDHSALPHYNPIESGEGCRKVHADDVYLVDSGAQYRDGTTDVTRTIFVNYEKACQEFIDHNTLVLKGHICLATTVFPTGLQGIRLDSFSRHSLWQAGLDFGHGTGHGVGHFLNVHEGPAGIGYRVKTEAIEASMVLTIEPGFYLPTKWGIRIENCYEVVSTKVPSGAKNFLAFLPLTLAPIQTTIINKDLLTKQEVSWLNEYHDRVLAVTGEYLKSAGKTDAFHWLVEQCKHI